MGDTNITDIMETVLNAYLNDGYIYCVSTTNPNIVKIGKTRANAKLTKESDVESYLLRRYETYYGRNHTNIVSLLRVGDVHQAEKHILDELRPFHFDKELFEISLRERDVVVEKFRMLQERFPTWVQVLGSMTDLQERVQLEGNMNKTIRALQLDEIYKSSRKKSIYISEIMQVPPLMERNHRPLPAIKKEERK